MDLRRTASALIVSAILFSPCLFAEGDSNPVGLWRGEIHRRDDDPNRNEPPIGSITVDGTKSEWSISLSKETFSQTFPLQRKENELTSAWFSNAGQFRGQLRDSKTLTGFWVQSKNNLDHNEYATPIEFTRVGNNLWRGVLKPLEARLTLWMSIQRAQDGSLEAVIRNPELNLFRRNVYRVDQHGDSLTFVNTKNVEEHFEGALSRVTPPEERVIEIRPPYGLSLPGRFWFKDAKEALGFFARVPVGQKPSYQRPKSSDDGWKTAGLQDVGLDSKPIAALIEKILQTDPANNSFPIHSLLLARHGKLVLEEYFYGFKGDEAHTMRSASKTFAPLLIGIARDHGAKVAINMPVLPQFPEYHEFANPDPRKSKITLRDLMTMTSGLACDDNDENSPGNEDVMQEQTAQPDWYKYTLDLPIARDPGGDQAVYCSAGINLLGGIVHHATHAWLPEFFYENVAKPLQITTFYWNLMPNGEGYAGGGLYLRPRDQLKLGQLYLDGGVWNGKRVLSKDWVQQSITRQSTFGKTLGADHDYGYGWHLYHFEVVGHNYRAYAAGGNGGQIVMVLPDLDMVVGFTGGAYGEFSKWYKWQTELVPQFIIPAATSGAQP